MSDLEVEPDEAADAPADGASVVWSPSRLTLAGKCGAAYEYNYVHKVSTPSTGALVLGNVVHNGVDEWYQLGHTEVELASAFRVQWREQVSEQIWSVIDQLATMQHELDALEQFIRLRRPNIKAPQQTKEYMTSKHYSEQAEVRGLLLEVAEQDEIEWSSQETPWQLYQRSMTMAQQISARWKPQPVPLLVEGAFTVQIGEFTVRGRIDQLRVDLNQAGEVFHTICDLKTGKNPLTAMEAFLQSYIYWRAIQTLEDMPPTDRVAFFLTRYNEYQVGQVQPHHEQMALKILASRQAMVSNHDYAPNYGYWCKQCNFRDLCADELGLWSEDGRVLDLVTE